MRMYVKCPLGKGPGSLGGMRFNWEHGVSRAVRPWVS